jgi:hypothetical protein
MNGRFTVSADQDSEYEYAVDGLTDQEVQQLREEAQMPWINATVAHLKFQALVAETLKKRRDS